MGPIQFWPENGFNIKYYPYIHQEGYRQPLVMIKFKKPKNGVLIQVCTTASPFNTKTYEIGASITNENGRKNR